VEPKVTAGVQTINGQLDALLSVLARFRAQDIYFLRGCEVIRASTGALTRFTSDDTAIAVV
jgi:hypothetical protein